MGLFLFFVQTKPKDISAIIVKKYIIVPELNGSPIELTKKSSNDEIRLTALGIKMPWTKPRTAIEIINAFIAPDLEYSYFLQ